MQITITDEAVEILQDHLDGWNELCESNVKLTPEVVSRLVDGMIQFEAFQCNLFEDYGND